MRTLYIGIVDDNPKPIRKTIVRVESVSDVLEEKFASTHEVMESDETRAIQQAKKWHAINLEHMLGIEKKRLFSEARAIVSI